MSKQQEWNPVPWRTNKISPNFAIDPLNPKEAETTYLGIHPDYGLIFSNSEVGSSQVGTYGQAGAGKDVSQPTPEFATIRAIEQNGIFV